MSDEECKFRQRVDASGDCWEWTGSKNQYGYGITTSNKKAHRVAYELEGGTIPEGMVIDHICHNRGCVKPAHLRVVTRKQNAENLSGVYSTSRSGVRGVSWHSGTKMWRAVVMHNRKSFSAGTFATIPEAEAAVIAKRNELFTHNDADRAQ